MTSNNTQREPIKRALISVYDKTGLEELARDLHEIGVEVISAGSATGKIAVAGVPVTPVKNLTGFPECLEGHVKALHPYVHAGILANTRKGDHLAQLRELGVEAFQLVVVNLYPSYETVASGASYNECVKQIDIGGPSMVRVAAKNHPSVAIVVDPARYGDIATAVKEGDFTLEQRREFARDAFLHTAEYDAAISDWFIEQLSGARGSAPTLLRHGENSHQSTALTHIDARGLADAKQLNGEKMSYSNYQDADAARHIAWDHKRPYVAIIEHANPCDIAVLDESIAAAHRVAHARDPVFAFGDVIAVNHEVSVEMAEQVKDIFTEVVVTPSYESSTVEVLKARRNLRILVAEYKAPTAENKFISGGLLTQEPDIYQTGSDKPENWELAAGETLSTEGLVELESAWRSVRAVKSNAILLSKGNATVGVDVGQVNRVDSAKLAVEHANALTDRENRIQRACVASDTFFLFADGLQVLIGVGVRAVVQSGGSTRDEEAITATEEAGVTIYMTSTRHFFY